MDIWREPPKSAAERNEAEPMERKLEATRVAEQLRYLSTCQYGDKDRCQLQDLKYFPTAVTTIMSFKSLDLSMRNTCAFPLIYVPLSLRRLRDAVSIRNLSLGLCVAHPPRRCLCDFRFASLKSDLAPGCATAPTTHLRQHRRAPELHRQYDQPHGAAP